jgi:hypothetical protein
MVKSSFIRMRAVTGAIRTVFQRFAEFGSARRVWLWFRPKVYLSTANGAAGMPGPIRWSLRPTTHSINPHQSGALAHVRQDQVRTLR